MPLAVGQALSFYEILGPLGTGAMGEVYRAKDTRLDRAVAIKVLPEHFAEDEERLARFEREAKILASLNHPNVAQIFGVDKVEETSFLVLELVEGEGLDQRLARGPLPVDEAVEICARIADGLDAAHESGVIHRDLKPANVRVTPGGDVKVLDFGLSKPARSGEGESRSDSVLTTEAGRLLGTPTYMAPEQVRGKAIDRRIDIWALGCVLYECLTGRRAFDGESLGDVMATVLEKEPDLSRLPSATPAHVRDVVERCLEKDPRKRLRDAGDARLELERSRTAMVVAPRGSSWTLWLGGAVVLAGLLGYGLHALLDGPRVPAPIPQVVRFSIDDLGIPVDAFQGLALSPDGTKLVSRAIDEDGRERLILRRRDTGEVRSIPGTDFGWLPFFAPDGDRLGFYAVGELKTVTLSSDFVRTLGTVPAGFSGGAWLADDTILVTGGRGIWRVPAGGGELEEV